MAIKRSHEQQTKTEIMKPLKRLRHVEQTEPNETMADRLSTLPEDLQLRILSSLKTKDAFQTSLLSKTWSSKWTHVPVLNFDTRGSNKLKVFDKFVSGALSVPRSAKLKKLIFSRRRGTCSAKMLKEVFSYAFRQGVEELEVIIIQTRKETSWPMIMSRTSWDSLKTLKLESCTNIGCPYLGPTSGSFKNLATLHLREAIITDVNPFSGFPALKKLKLFFCHLQTDDNSLNIHAPHLLELTISFDGIYRDQGEIQYTITAPNLKYFEFRGSNFPRFEVTRALPVLDSVIIEYNGLCEKPLEKKLFDDMMMFLNVLCNVKSLTIYSSVVHVLSLFPDELENRCSPFRDLKSYKVDLSLFYRQKLFEGKCMSLSEALRRVSRVTGYLLQKSPDAKCTMIDPKTPLTERPGCSNLHECICGLFYTIFHIY